MKKEYEKCLEANLRYLEDILEVGPVAHLCHERQVLAYKDLERILAERSRPDQTLKFVKILKCKPENKAFETFLEVLCDPSVDQSYVRERLEQTKFAEELHAGLEDERLLEQILKDSFMIKEDFECPVEEIIRIIRVQLRRHRKSLDVSGAEIFDLARTIFPAVKLRKNRRKNVVAVQNWCVKPEAQKTVDAAGEDEDVLEAANPIPLDEISADRVTAVLRVNFFGKHKLDVTLAERLLEEKVDASSLSLLTAEDIKDLYPELKLGERKKFEKACKETLEELQKPPESLHEVQSMKKKSPRKLETYRVFDTRPGATDVYEKGHVLPDEQSRPGHLLEAIHKYYMIKSNEINILAQETMRFAAACMNERVNGTIHFGVASKFVPQQKVQAGEIVGFHVEKHQCEVAITDEIYRAFYPDQREAALKCIRDPVYIPVVAKDALTQDLHVVEIDVIPHSDLVTNEAFFLNPTVGKHAVLFRYVDGAATEVSGQELQQFMNFRKERTDLRKDNEKTMHTQPQQRPDLHRKLHGLLTGENDYDVTDTFPVLFLSPCSQCMTDEYLMEHFRCIKSLEPLAVFDFDPSTQDLDGQSHGLCTMMESHLDQVYKALTTDNFDKDSEENRASQQGVSKLLESIAVSSFRSWIFCNGYEPLGKKELQDVPTWRSQRAQGFKEAVRFYKEQIPSGKAQIIIFLLSRRYDVLLVALEEIFVKFPDQWILVAESERVAQELMSEVIRRCYVERQVLEERSVIGMPWSHLNQSIMNICGYNAGIGCTIPSSTGAPCHMKERARNELPDLEILSMTQCNEEANVLLQKSEDELEKKKRSTEEEFYRGKEVSWWNFFFRDHVLRREQFNTLLEKVSEPLDGFKKNIPEDEKVVVKTLLHQPGAGGTTTAREILWELKSKVRCCVVKQITDQTCDQIARLRSFEEPDCPKPPLVLIDNEDEEKVFQLCSYINEKARREARDSRGPQKIFCVLIICVRMTAFPPKKDKHKVMLGHELLPEEVQWFKTKYEILEERYHKKQLKVHPKLLISFNILKENFNPDYIRRTVDEFISKISDPKEKHLLKYIALINSFDFDFQSIPMSCFNVLMNPAASKGQQKPRLGQKLFSKGDIHWEASLSQSLNVLLNRTSKQCMGGDIKAVRIINNNLSRAILNNICCRENHTVSDVVLEFLHSSIFKKSNESSVQNQLVKIMKDMLKKRAAYKKGRAKFSPIILEIGEKEGFEKAAEVLKVGFDLFDDPMIAQQIARVYIHCQNWRLADEYARIAQDMKPKNSYLCDTHGQVYKEQLIRVWKECLESEEQLEGEKARNVIDLAFKALEIFRREQKLSDDDCTGYNNCGFFSELRVLVTILDCCRFLKAFKCDKGQMLHRFLVDPAYVPPELSEYLDKERINMLKKLYTEYERPMRRLEDEQIQLKEDSCYQYSPSYSNSVKDRRMFVHLQECLDTYFGEDSDELPGELRKEDACEFRRRRVKRKGGNSLRSIYGLRDDENAAEEFRAMHKIIEQNVRSEYCNAFDLRTILNLTLARVSLDKRQGQDIPMGRILEWTQQLYEKAKKESFSYLEAYLYLVMFHWPTEWRNQQGLPLCSCNKIKDVIKEWKTAFQTNHPAQKEEEGKKPDRRKGTTLFFLGLGEGFDEIVFYSELAGYSKRQKLGDSIWDTDLARDRLKRLRGTLLHGGGEMSVKICSAKGNVTELEIPTSFPIKDHSLWQKSVQFVLGFCWSGPKAYSVTRDDNVDLRSVPMPQNFTISRRNFDRAQQKMMSVEAVEEFWQRYFDNQVKLELVEKDIRLCTNKKRAGDLRKKKETLEKDRLMLVMKRTSVLQGPD